MEKNETNEIELLFVEPTDREHCGLPVVIVNGEEYAVAEDEEQADKAAKDAAMDTLWAFNVQFLSSFLPCHLNDRQRQAIQNMQNTLCEDAGPIVALLLGDKLDEMLKRAVSLDGRGHFLSPYDGQEYNGEDISPALAGKLVYRL